MSVDSILAGLVAIRQGARGGWKDAPPGPGPAAQ
jgi:hypothetical protein